MSNNQGDNQNYITKMEHDEVYRVKKVSSYIQDEDGNLIREQTIGRVDSGNSTSTPLVGGATFTGNSMDITNYGIVFVNVYTDVISATDGLVIEQSSDGTNWDHSDMFTLQAGGAKNFSINPYAKYMRVVYTNGAGAQSVFRLQTILKANSKPSSHRIQDTISSDDDAELIKSVLTGKDANGDFINVSTTEDGNLTVSDNSDGLAIAKGDVTGHSFVHKFGNAPDFDTADGEVTIWDGAEDGTAWELMDYVYSTTADIDSISSSDVGDTHDIEIQGLDTNWELVGQTVTLNGQTRVALTTPLIRVFRAFNSNSADLNGDVFIYVNGTLSGGVPVINADIRAIINPFNQQTEMAVYTIPAGKTGYMREWYMATSGGNKASSFVVRLVSRNFGKVFRTKHTSAINQLAPVPYQHNYHEPEIFAEKTDIEMRVQSKASPTSTGNSVSAGFDIVLVDN